MAKHCAKGKISTVHFVVIWVLCLGVANADPIENDKCLYEIDKERNKINVICGKNMQLTVKQNNGELYVAGLQLAVTEKPEVSTNDSRKHGALYENPMEKITNASHILKRLEKKLNTHSDRLGNITDLLQRGDRVLRTDLQRVRQLDANSATSRETMIAAIQNQYNFLRMGLLSQNAEFRQLVFDILTLVTATEKTVRGILGMEYHLDNQIDELNETMTDAMFGGWPTGRDKAVMCPQQLANVGEKDDSITIGMATGTVMKDPAPDGKFWLTFNYSNINQVLEYDNMKALRYDLVTETHELPFFCEGTGHVVYRNAFYCHKMMTNKITKYNLNTYRWESERSIDGAGVHNTYAYQSGKYSDIDFAVDEHGLWVIYATSNSNGNIIISKVNEIDLSFSKTWTTNILKNLVGNTFMVCGVLYATDSYASVPTFIRYMYDTTTGQSKTLESHDIAFSNSLEEEDVLIYMLDYDPSDRKLYSWNNGRVVTYPVIFQSNFEP